MLDIVYFVQGKDGRYINKYWKRKIIIGNNVSQEGYYYIEKVEEKERCWIFYGKPYTPSEADIPSHVIFNPNSSGDEFIDQGSIKYLLVKHKKSGAHFVICSYLLNRRIFRDYQGLYRSDLLTFFNGKWERIEEWPFNAERCHVNDKIEEYLRKYGNYYEEDFEVIREL